MDVSDAEVIIPSTAAAPAHATIRQPRPAAGDIFTIKTLVRNAKNLVAFLSSLPQESVGRGSPDLSGLSGIDFCIIINNAPPSLKLLPKRDASLKGWPSHNGGRVNFINKKERRMGFHFLNIKTMTSFIFLT